MSKIKQMTTRKVIGTRPMQAPEGWPIYNAPRPLYGSTTWQGDFYHGIFYAAIDPADSLAGDWAERNQELDGWLLEWVTEEQAIAESMAYYQEKLPRIAVNIDLNDKDHRGMVIDGWHERQRGW